MTRRQRLRQPVNGPFAEFNELVGLTEQFALGERYAS